MTVAIGDESGAVAKVDEDARALQVLTVDADGNPSASAGSGSVDDVTITRVDDSDASQQMLAANPDRKGVIAVNDSDQVAFIKFGATATATDYTYRLAENDTWEMSAPLYTGRIDVVWAADSTGGMQVTEL